jgi:arylsulfatase A-like enzyme
MTHRGQIPRYPEAHDDLKVQAILNEIAGMDHTGTKKAPVPAIFGMNFQAVSVTQKLTGDGYLDATGAPSPELQAALDHTDQSLAHILAALSQHGLLSKTAIILTAKHGQSTIDPNQVLGVAKATIASVVGGLLAQAAMDDVALLWLTDQSKVNAVVADLSTKANESAAHIQEILTGDALTLLYNDPTADSRTPDIIVLPEQGVIYSTPLKKIAEHGGFSNDDTHVPLIIANPHLNKGTVFAAVQTTQIAPTILHLLGLNPEDLQAAGIEQTKILPGI